MQLPETVHLWLRPAHHAGAHENHLLLLLLQPTLDVSLNGPAKTRPPNKEQKSKQYTTDTSSTLTHLPCLQHAVLQGAGVAEGHMPGVGALVHGVQVQGGLQLRLWGECT